MLFERKQEFIIRLIKKFEFDIEESNELVRMSSYIKEIVKDMQEKKK